MNKFTKISKIIFSICGVIIFLSIIVIIISNLFNKDIEQPVMQINNKKSTHIDYKKLLQENTKTLNAGQYLFEDKFKEASFYKVKAINPNNTGNFIVKDNNGNLITNEIMGNDSTSIKECITVLNFGYSIDISGIDRIMFTPVIKYGIKPKYEYKELVAGYHSVGYTVAEGKYTIKSKRGTGNLIIYRGNSLIVNEIFSKDIGIQSYSVILQDNDLIYTSGLYVSLYVVK